MAASSAGALAQSAVPYGPGENDGVDGGYYFAQYDSVLLSGAGVASTWEGESGYVAALPIYYEGTDAVTLEMVHNTPIPAFPMQTRIQVAYPRNGAQVTVTLIGYGPAIWTGAAIALSSDAKQALGFPPGIDSYVNYQILQN
jgi:hypothetical protein